MTNLFSFHLEHPVPDLAEAVVNLVTLCDLDDHGVPDITLADIQQMWSTLDLSHNVWIALTDQTQLVGYAFLDIRGETRMDTCVFVHPDYKGNGIGSALLDQAEQRAYELTGGREGQRLMNHLPFTNTLARRLAEARGYTFQRLYQRMKLVLDKNPLPEGAAVPKGIRIEPIRPGQDEGLLHGIYEASFQDAWGYSTKDAAVWIKEQQGDAYDPSLWFIAWEGTKPIGFLISNLQDDGLFIELLGVVRSHRHRGVGQALLTYAFAAGYARGERTVLLYVDTDSLTGAQRLYRKLGMQPDLQTALYVKELAVK
ncbi:GNAT family N-acetyltransferase [Paenibacillus sp. CAA11]|uniref:GNAT family N-acetyltransferase n=1 Tax=Paenibacillus sp. CAA11 TaxID=1532905 RepID=UPI00131EF40E|nr:GNAT family N-acetyltransferase [Paenibacillus sp. CAA11]